MAQRPAVVPLEEGVTPTPEPAGLEAVAPEVGEEEEQSNVTEEEQAAKDAVMDRYMTAMYVKGQKPLKEGEPSLLDTVHEFFKAAKDENTPVSYVDALGNATASVVMVLEDTAETAGQPIPGDILMHAGMDILSDLAELSDNGGYHEFTDKEMVGAATVAMNTYREVRQGQGKLDENAIKADYEAMTAADKAGKIDEFLPGASAAAGMFEEEDEGQPAPEQQPQAAPPMMPGLAGAPRRTR